MTPNVFIETNQLGNQKQRIYADFKSDDSTRQIDLKNL
jgi:hypothetical protein